MGSVLEFRREWELLGCPLGHIGAGGDWGAVLLLFPSRMPRNGLGVVWISPGQCLKHPVQHHCSTSTQHPQAMSGGGLRIQDHAWISTSPLSLGWAGFLVCLLMETSPKAQFSILNQKTGAQGELSLQSPCSKRDEIISVRHQPKPPPVMKTSSSSCPVRKKRKNPGASQK